MVGYVCLYRSLKEWEWYHDLPVRVLFLHLMLEVNWKPGRFQGIEILPGQIATSTEKLAAGSGLTRQTIRTALSKLQSTNQITIQPTNRFSVVTIVDWDKYQFVPEEPTNNQPTDNHQLTSNQPTDNHQLTTIEEGNKEIRRKGKKERIEKKVPIGTLAVGPDPNVSSLSSPSSAPADDPTPTPPVPRPLPKEDRRDPGVQAVIDYLTAKLIENDLGKSLDGSVNENRFAASNLLKKLAKERPDFDPVSSAKALIDFAMRDEFHSRNSTKVGYLYRNLAKLRNDFIASKNNKKTQTDDDRKAELAEALHRRFVQRRENGSVDMQDH